MKTFVYDWFVDECRGLLSLTTHDVTAKFYNRRKRRLRRRGSRGEENVRARSRMVAASPRCCTCPAALSPSHIVDNRVGPVLVLYAVAVSGVLALLHTRTYSSPTSGASLLCLFSLSHRTSAPVPHVHLAPSSFARCAHNSDPETPAVPHRVTQQVHTHIISSHRRPQHYASVGPFFSVAATPPDFNYYNNIYINNKYD